MSNFQFIANDHFFLKFEWEAIIFVSFSIDIRNFTTSTFLFLVFWMNLETTHFDIIRFQQL